MNRTRAALLALVLIGAGLALLLWLRSDGTTGTGPTPQAAVADDPSPSPGTSRPAALRPSPGSTAAAQPTRTSTRPAMSAVLLKAAWGSGPGQLGHHEPNESNAEGPAAIAVDRDDVVVLDQVNGRVVRYRRGVPFSTFEVSETVQDIALAANGNAVVLDRLADKSITIHGPDGTRLSEIPVEGNGIDDASLTTGVFADDDGIWVEREHGNLVRVANSEGQADDARAESPGRRTRDGKRVVTAAIADAALGRVIVTAFQREDLTVAWGATYDFSRPVLQLLLLDSDDAGQVYVGAEGARERADFTPYDAAIMVVRFAPDGSVSGLIELPATAHGEEIQRPLAVGEDGAVYLMQATPSGMVLTRHTFP